MKYAQGNLIDLALAGEFDLIAHGANCFCTMGEGLASGRWVEIEKVINKVLPSATIVVL